MSEEEWESAITSLAISGSTSAGRSASAVDNAGGGETSAPIPSKASPVLSVPVPVPVVASGAPVTSAAALSKAVSSSELELADVMSIDDGLISALVNPRERLNALTYEKRILEFIASPDNVLDIPPIYNSFHRLLLYRIAQRFNLDHCQSEAIYPYGERGICIIRTASTAIPRALLIEVSKRDDLLSQTSPPMSGYDLAPNTQSSAALKSSTVASAPAPGKIKVMKRNTSGSNMDKKSLTDKSTVDISDKEKAYAEARARIFGDEPPTPEEIPTSLNVPTAPTMTPSATGPQSAPAAPYASGKSSSSNETRSPTASQSTPALPSQAVHDRRDVPSRQVNPNSWSRERAVLRDREAERNDPDFARRPPGGVAPTLSYQGYGGMPAAPYGYGYAYVGGAMPPQGGYPSWQGQVPYTMGYAPSMGYQNPRGYGAPPPPPTPPPNSGRGYAPQSGRSYKDEFPQLG